MIIGLLLFLSKLSGISISKGYVIAAFLEMSLEVTLAILLLVE